MMTPVSSASHWPRVVYPRCWLLAGLVGCVAARTDASAGAPPGESQGSATRRLAPIEATELSVTAGEIRRDGPGRFSIRSPTLRAEFGHEPRSAAELEFVYRGPTASDAPLASGELRRQIGLKLRARDTCNVVYVMWHIEPSPGIVVSVKSNPGQSRHVQCGDKGYSFLTPAASRPVARIEAGQSHVLGATIQGRTLRVDVDGQRSWEGELPPTAFDFNGPVGVRSDNGEFSVELRAEEPTR